MKPLHSETVYSTPWFDVVAKTMRTSELPYYSLRLPDYVGILAITEDQRILTVRQYRPAVEQYTLELPAGLMDLEETPVATSTRELLEETGYRADEMHVLGELTTDTGRHNNRIWACFATGVRKLTDYQPEVGLETIAYTNGELMEAVREGQFNMSLHVAILMLAAAKGLITVS